MNENKMYKRLACLLKDYPIMLQRIENRTGRVPDIYFSSSKRNGWIELKEVEKEKKGRVKIPFRPGQLAWIKRHLKYNDDILLLCSVKNTAYWILTKGKQIKEEYGIDELILLTGKHLKKLFSMYCSDWDPRSTTL
jgi:hypothetical protein